MLRKRNLFFFLSLFILFLSSSCFAITLTPSGFETEYTPGAVREFTFFGEGCPCLISLEGELSNSSTFLSDFFLPTTQQFKVQLTIPELSPGSHSLLVRNSEVPPEKKYGQPTGVSSLASVIAKIKVNVPYPGKYLEASLLDISKNNQAGQPVYFNINVQSRGKEEIKKIKGLIDIYDSTEKTNKITTVPLTEIDNFPSLGSGVLYAEWNTLKLTKPGQYQASAKIDYDGTEIIAERSFLLGTPQIEILSLFPPELPNTEISTLALGLKSVWNENINFYVNLLVKDENGQLLKEMKSQNFDLAPWTNFQANVFFDPLGLPAKEYTLEVILHYLNLETKKEFKIKLLSPPPKPKEVAIQQPQGNLNPFLIVIIIALIAAICGLLFKYYQKKEIE